MARKVCFASVLVSFGLLAAAQASAAGEWITSEEGVRLWNSNPQPNETCRWTGGKDEDGLAQGGGLVLWATGGRLTQVASAQYEHGREHGLFVMLLPDGRVGAVLYEHGQPVNVSLKVERAGDASADDDLPDTVAELERERAKSEELVRLTKSFVDDWDQRMKEVDAITAAGMLRYKLQAMDRHAAAQTRLRAVQVKLARVKSQEP